MSPWCVLTLDLCEVLQCGTPVPQFGWRGTGILKRNLVNVVEGHSHPVPLKHKNISCKSWQSIPKLIYIRTDNIVVMLLRK
jgi:hypothetical protein